MTSPTEKQIDFVEAIAEVLGIDFPQSSKEFTKRTYRNFIDAHYIEFKRVMDDYSYDDDEMLWFQMLNGD